MSVTIKGQGFEGAGHGLVRVSGSFAVASSAIVITGSQKIRPSKGNFTVTRQATGVYLVVYAQAFQSVVSAGAQIGDAAGQTTNTYRTGVGAYTWVSQDFMKSNGAFTQYLTDFQPPYPGSTAVSGATNKAMLILVFNTSNNALTDVPANTRLSFDFCFASSAENN